MGIEDRDYYRENYARRNGMRYDKKGRFYRLLRTASDVPKVGADWHWSLKFLLWLVIVLVVLVVMRFVAGIYK